MRRPHLIVFTLLLTGCVKFHCTAKLPIEAPVSQLEKERLAAIVAQRISDPDVRSQVQRAFALTDEQAATLFAGPQTFAIRSIADRDVKPSTTVSVVVGIRNAGSMKKAEAVAEFYRGLARAELNRQLAMSNGSRRRG